MKRVSLLLVIFTLLTGFSGCQDNDDFALNQIDIEIVTMQSGVELSVFDKGTDVILALKMTNNSDKNFEWYYDYECALSTQQDFLLVKKKITTEDPDLTSIPVGTPYQFPLNCPAINLPPRFVIPPGSEKIVVAYPWSSNPENTELLSGEYFSEFTITIIADGQQKSWNLRTDFIIH
jgi:hypothetical protein